MISTPRAPTLDQIAAFLAVVETGSFAGAGRKLGRAVSAVSYAIANLEGQLGLSLFTRAGSRRPRLTEAGAAILSDTRGIAFALDGLLAKARGLTGGLEAEVSLAVDVMVPTPRLVAALEEFRRHFPTVALRLQIEALGAVTQMVLDGVADFGISGPLHPEHDALERAPAGTVCLVAVAAASHPLARVKGPLTARQVREAIQLVLSDRSRLTAGRDFGVLSAKSWRLGDLGAKHALLLAGLGWGNMPAAMVRADIAAGRLVALRIGGEGEATGMARYPLHSVHRRAQPPGPAGHWLMARLSEDHAMAPASGAVEESN